MSGNGVLDAVRSSPPSAAPVCNPVLVRRATTWWSTSCRPRQASTTPSLTELVTGQASGDVDRRARSGSCTLRRPTATNSHLSGSIAVVADARRLRVAARRCRIRRRRRAGARAHLCTRCHTVRALEGLDVTRHWSAVELHRRHGDQCRPRASPPRLTRRSELAAVLAAAETVGAMDDRLRDGAAIRQGPHRFRTADRLVPGREAPACGHQPALEMSKAVAVAAATDVGVEDGYGSEAASMAKAFVGGRGHRSGPELLPGVRRHRVHLGARPTPVPAPLDHRRRPVRRPGLAPRAALSAGSDSERNGDAMTATSSIDSRPSERGTRLARGEPGASDGRRARAWGSESKTRRGDRRRARDRSGGCTTAVMPGSPARRSTAGGVCHTAHERAFRRGGARLRDARLRRRRAGSCSARSRRDDAGPRHRPSSSHRHIPKMLSGEELVVSVLLRARGRLRPGRVSAPGPTRDGDRWILNGSKIWSTGADYADYGMCLARTDWDVPEAPRPHLVRGADRRAAGLTVQPHQPDQRRRRVLPGVLRRRRAQRRRHHRRGQRGLDRRPDDAGLRAWRQAPRGDGGHAGSGGLRR